MSRGSLSGGGRLLDFDQYRLASGFLDLRLGGFGETVGLDGDGAGDFPCAEDLEEEGSGTKHASGLEFFEAEGLTFEFFEVTDVQYFVINPIDVVEAALGQPAVKRHLAAFEAGTMATAGAGLHAFVATTRSLTVTGTAAAAEDFMAMSGALDFGQRVEFHVCVFRLGAESLDLFEGTELGETVQSGLDDSLGIVGSHGLRKDILVTSHFEHSADATAGDEAGTGSSRTEHHDAAVGMADDFVRDGVAAEIDANEGAVGAVSSLADRIGDFLGLTVTDANAALAITCHDERGEDEATAPQNPKTPILFRSYF